MKLSVVLLFLLGAALAGYNPLIVQDGDEIVAELGEGNHNHYVLLFYMPAEQTSHLGYRNEKLLQEVKDDFLEPNKVESLYFATVNVAHEGYQKLIDLVQLDIKNLSEGPTVLVMEHGNGFLVRGPQTAESLNDYLQQLQQNKEQGFR